MEEPQGNKRVPWWLVAVLVVLFGLSLLLWIHANYQSGQRSWNLVISGLLAKWIYWTPRIAGILIILFVAMFSLDVFLKAEVHGR